MYFYYIIKCDIITIVKNINWGRSKSNWCTSPIDTLGKTVIGDGVKVISVRPQLTESEYKEEL